MNRIVTIFSAAICLIFSLYANLQAQNENGIIDNIEELAEKQTIPLTMPDGTDLMADVYLPVLQDSIAVKIPFSAADTISVALFSKGTQYIYYDSVNGEKADKPYELPVIYLRTPYNKSSETIGNIMSFLGYAVIIQDNRGTYESEGVYLPMYSDAWSKTPYHPDYQHKLDITSPDDPRNANNHEDGYHSLQIINELERSYRNDTFLISNGNIGMIGASALGNAQYQLAAARKINPEGPGLKALMPIVATNEHYRFTAVQNGVFRQQLVNGWITRQYENLLDNSLVETDNTIDNNLHSPADYNLSTKSEVAEEAIDYWISYKRAGEVAGYYPNSYLRPDLDASFAPVNRKGEGAANGQYSRYTNMKVPMYHLTGWWDIFIDGQIETYNNLMKHLDDEYIKNQQKLVIGPWAHQTVTERKTGDITYPENVHDFLYDLLSLDTDLESLPLESLFNSEIMQWFRYHLNNNPWKSTGLPKIIIPESEKWEQASIISYKVPSSDYVIPYTKFLNFLAGKDSLTGMPYAYQIFGNEVRDSITIPAPDKPMIQMNRKIHNASIKDFEQVPNVRLYVVGPVNDGINENTGNYWLNTDSFPLKQNISKKAFYLHKDGSFGNERPSNEEADSLIYIHDPNHPVLTAGGANMITRTPVSGRRSQGQMNLADEELAEVTMNRPDVLAFESVALKDSLSVIGYPEVLLVAKSEPTENYSDSTNTDFFVRILDVYPDGKTYFVTEGAINARAREYVRENSNFTKAEDPSIPFTNIASDRQYKFSFKMMPLAYTFGKGHKIKVLISSSNYPRYQSNPNIPLEPGEFFRWEPHDETTYNFRGKDMSARKAKQTLFVMNEPASRIYLPVYGESEALPVVDIRHPSLAEKNDAIKIYPNPVRDHVNIISQSSGNKLLLYDISGQKLREKQFEDYTVLDLTVFDDGIYMIKIVNLQTGEQIVRKILKR